MSVLGDGSSGAGQGDASGAGGNSGGGNNDGTGSGGAGTSGNASAGGSASWRDSLPEDIRANPAISSFQDVPSLVKSFINAQQLVGRKGAIPPKDWGKSTPEERAEFFKTAGLPDPDKYSVEIPQGLAMTPEEKAVYTRAFHELGVLPHQANGILSKHAEITQAANKAAADAKAAAFKKGIDDIKKDLGEGYDSKVAKANLLIENHMPKEFGEYLVKSGLGNDPNVIRGFIQLADKFLSEDQLREGGLGDGKMTHQEVQSQLDEIMAKGDTNGFFDATHPMHATTVAKVESLRKMLTGGK
jgi:hypothetical protein